MKICLLSLFQVTLLNKIYFNKVTYSTSSVQMRDHYLFAKVWKSLQDCKTLCPEKCLQALRVWGGEGLVKLCHLLHTCTYICCSKRLLYKILVTSNKRLILGPWMTLVNIGGLNFEQHITVFLQCTINLSPSYFLMKCTWIHSIELHSEEQLVRRLQSCTQRKENTQLWRGVSGDSKYM